jgi:hypothetical protein
MQWEAPIATLLVRRIHNHYTAVPVRAWSCCDHEPRDGSFLIDPDGENFGYVPVVSVVDGI